MNKRILITGASGCIGHYITERLIQNTNHELFLIVRNIDKLGFDIHARPGIYVLQADLREIDQFTELFKTINIAILAATSWGGKPEVYQVNVDSTLKILQSLDLNTCEQVLYFSTASVLGQDNQLLKEAGEIGTDYIKSKYHCLYQILQIAADLPPLRILYPTLVFGGDKNKPVSHLSSGIAEVTKWISLIRWFKAEGSFHFIHGADIAKVVEILISKPINSERVEHLVLGNKPIKLNEAIQEVCGFYKKRIYFRFNLSPWLINFFIVLFRVQMADWDRFCLDYRHFTYQNIINPERLNQSGSYPTLTDILKSS
ncbi:MAG: NAD(P)-dependent oxidoreductase [Microcoleaceae cyanobacterium]